MTVRKELIGILQRDKMTIREMALHFRTTTEEIAEDLRHIGKSIYPRMELRMETPMCKNCGFVFKGRSKLKPPSKCPECRGMKISEPRFWIRNQ
jgi:predicted Zn-ribbon and HTH transcriptional regulator